MSKYKVGDVAALFSAPKEPTTQAGKKLQSLFEQFHSKNKSTFQDQEVSEKKNKKSKPENEVIEDQKTFKKNKKRKISATFDQESSLSEHKKVKMTDSQDVGFKNKEKKNKNFSEEREFPRKKKKAFKSNSLNSSTFNNSEINGSFENETKSMDTSELNISSKSKKVKSSFVKKSKHQTWDANNSFDRHQNKKHKVETELSDNNDESLKEEVKDFIKSNSKKSKKKNLSNIDSDTIKLQFDNSVNNSESEPSSNFEKSLKGKKVKSGFIKKSKCQTYDANNNFDRKSKKYKLETEVCDNNDESLEEKVEEFIKSNSKKPKKKNLNNIDSDIVKLQFDNSVNNLELESSSNFEKSPRNTTEVSGFIRRPKNRNKATNNKFERDNNKSNNSAFNNSDTLFKSENEDYTQNDKKKFKKKFDNVNYSVQNSSKKSFSKNEPEFVKLLEKDPTEVESVEVDRLSRTLFVGNLPVTTRLNDLKDLFSQFGEIDFIRFKGIETDKAKIFSENPPKSLNANYAADSVPGFIVFKERESAIKALSLSGTVFKGRHITVDFAMPSGSKKLYDEKRSIFIGNLPFGVEDESVWDAFLDCGKIEGVRIVRDKDTGIGKGFGYVLFNNATSRNIALSKTDLKIEGRPVRIKAVDSNKKMQNKTDASPVKRDTFKSRAIAFKKKNKNVNSRKSITKLVKKEKTLHKKKKIASLLQKSMK